MMFSIQINHPRVQCATSPELLDKFHPVSSRSAKRSICSGCLTLNFQRRHPYEAVLQVSSRRYNGTLNFSQNLFSFNVIWNIFPELLGEDCWTLNFTLNPNLFTDLVVIEL